MNKVSTIKKFIYIIAIILLVALLGLSITELLASNEGAKNYLTQNSINLKDIEYKENKKDNLSNPEKDEPSEYEQAFTYFCVPLCAYV